VSDVLVLTLGLLAAVVACLARPCTPLELARVKASRRPLEPLPSSGYAAVDEQAPASEPGFADGLTAPA